LFDVRSKILFDEDYTGNQRHCGTGYARKITGIYRPRQGNLLMIIALTAEETVVGELEIIPALFEQGLDLLHLRKYHFTDAQMCRYIASIGEQYHSRLVLHSHPHLSAALGIYR